MYLNTDILFTTTGGVSGREITDYLGILIKREVVSGNIDTQEMLYALDARYASLAAAMNERAKDIRADAVVGVDFRMDMLGDKIVFTMTGNAVRLKDAGNMQPEMQPAETPEAEEAVPEMLVFPESEDEEAAAQAPAEEEADIPAEIFVFEEAEPEACEESGWHCPNCGTANDAQYRYCPRCGEMRVTDWACGGCGQQNPPEYKFCPGCGKPRA